MLYALLALNRWPFIWWLCLQTREREKKWPPRTQLRALAQWITLCPKSAPFSHICVLKHLCARVWVCLRMWSACKRKRWLADAIVCKRVHPVSERARIRLAALWSVQLLLHSIAVCLVALVYSKHIEMADVCKVCWSKQMPELNEFLLLIDHFFSSFRFVWIASRAICFINPWISSRDTFHTHSHTYIHIYARTLSLGMASNFCPVQLCSYS